MTRDKKSEPASLLTRKFLLEMAGPTYFARGEDYFKRGLVENLSEFNGVISAVVAGTEDYQVKLRAEQGTLDYSCTCPLGENQEFCKHCVATGLEWMDQKKSQDHTKAIESREEMIRKYLASREKSALIEMISKQAENYPEFQDQLLIKAAVASGKGADLKSYRSLIDRATRVGDFIDYYQMPRFARKIHNLIDGLENLLEQGLAAETMELAEHCLKKVEKAIHQADDSDGHLDEILERLEELHLWACGKSKPDPEELARRLFEWEMSSDWEVFLGAAERYAGVLGEKGLAVYRKLAEEEWARLPRLGPKDKEEIHSSRRFTVTKIMESLARQSGDLEELVKIKTQNLSLPYYFLEIAEIYEQAGKEDQAIEWAERGLKEFAGRPDSRVILFLAEKYLKRNQTQEAIKLIWDEFRRAPTLKNYQFLKDYTYPSGEWPKWKPQAMVFLQNAIEKFPPKPNSWYYANSELIQIHLWEGELEAAWQEARQRGCSEDLWRKIAEKLEERNPEESVRIYQMLVEPTINGKNRQAYKETIKLLIAIKELMERRGQKQEFQKYLETVRDQHKRKTSFIDLLDKAKIAKPGSIIPLKKEKEAD